MQHRDEGLKNSFRILEPIAIFLFIAMASLPGYAAIDTGSKTQQLKADKDAGVKKIRIEHAVHSSGQRSSLQPASFKKPLRIRSNKSALSATFTSVDSKPTFDLPVTYNRKVSRWIKHFQGPGQEWFKTWLERSHRYLPIMQSTLRKKNMPLDLCYVAMIESGFSSAATSHAKAVGYWQFIRSTAQRYNLKIDWWIDERRDFAKSTGAATEYLSDLYKMFDSWYLTAAAYNMGEGRLKKLIKKHRTKDFWILSEKPDFPKETREYIPKLIAAMILSKSPKLYGFRSLEPLKPHTYEYFNVPGGTDLINLARHLNLGRDGLKLLNPDLLHDFIPKQITHHRIRIPQGYSGRVSRYLRERTSKQLAKNP